MPRRPLLPFAGVLASSLGFIGLLAAAPVAAQRPAQNAGRFLILDNLGVAVLPDSNLGVIVLAVPANRKLQPFAGRFDPERVRQWARFHAAELPDSVGVVSSVVGDDGSVLGIRARGPGRYDLIFQVLHENPYAEAVSGKDAAAFQSIIDSAAAQARRSPQDGPAVSTDGTGPVYWLAQGDSVTSFPETFDVPKPKYPQDLMLQRLSGFAWISFVVDTLGAAEPGSAWVMWASHPAFGWSAADAIARAHFSPGAYRGKAVRSGLIRLITFLAK